MNDNELRDRFDDFGYVIIDTELDHSILDGAITDLAKYFGSERETPIHVPHADHGRIQDAWHISQNVLKIATAPKVLRSLKALYDQEPKPF